MRRICWFRPSRRTTSYQAFVFVSPVFEMRAGIWTDLAIRTKAAPVEIEPFSNAYFALLRALPELEQVWKALPSSVTGGNRIAIAVKSGGKKQLSAAELNNLVTRFRS